MFLQPIFQVRLKFWKLDSLYTKVFKSEIVKLMEFWKKNKINLIPMLILLSVLNSKFAIGQSVTLAPYGSGASASYYPFNIDGKGYYVGRFSTEAQSGQLDFFYNASTANGWGIRGGQIVYSDRGMSLYGANSLSLFSSYNINLGYQTAGKAYMTIIRDDGVGIGVTTPSEMLDVNGTVRIRNIPTDNGNLDHLVVTGNGTLRKTNFGISDFRLKQNIKKLENPLEKIVRMRGVSYEFIENPNQKRMGFIAQEVEKVFPEAVFESENGFKGVRYDDLIPVLLEAIKSQQKQIESLTIQVGSLNESVKVFESRKLN